MAAYTDEQIKEVCAAGYEIMGKFTDVQNCNFPSTVIIQGMQEGKTAEEIANMAYDSIAQLPMRQTGFGLVSSNNIHNIASYMAGEVRKRIESFDSK